MLIDWFTVGAQALNFALLIWLMKRFLYRPVLDAIDSREKRIADELADADAKKAEASRERDDFRAKNEAFDRQRSELFARATEDVAAERSRLTDEAVKAEEAAASQRRGILQSEASTLDHAIGSSTRREVFAIVRKALADLAMIGLEEQVCQVFVGRLRDLGGPARNGLAEAIRTAKDGALVRSAFELAPPQRAAIAQALSEIHQADLALRFEVAPDLVAGIELAVNGQKLDWSIARYVESLGRVVEQLVDQPVRPDAAAASAGPSATAVPAGA